MNAGINTFSIVGLESIKVHEFLLKKKILTSISTSQTSTQYFKKKNIKSVVRVSFHYYNRMEDVKELTKCLKSLLNKWVDI